MTTPESGKSGLRDYLYYLLNQGNKLDSPDGGSTNQQAALEPNRLINKVGLLAPTLAEANRLLSLLTSAMQNHLTSPSNHHFTAYGLDEPNLPEKLLDEVHWVGSSSLSLPPKELLATIGKVRHIHLFGSPCAVEQEDFRLYRWDSKEDFTECMASLYLARELNAMPDLYWPSYLAWQLPNDHLTTVTSSRSKYLLTAVKDLLAKIKASALTTENIAILIIEGNSNITIGEHMQIVATIERNVEFDVFTSSWVSTNYSGYGLKLVRFSQQQPV